MLTRHEPGRPHTPPHGARQLEVVAQAFNALVAIVGRLCEELADDVREHLGHSRVDLANRRRLHRDVCVHQRERIVQVEDRPTGQELEERRTERVEVAPWSHPVGQAPRLFGSDTHQRPLDETTRLRFLRRRLGGQPEVDELHLPALRIPHDVRGVDVLVHDLLSMGVLEATEHSERELEHQIDVRSRVAEGDRERVRAVVFQDQPRSLGVGLDAEQSDDPIALNPLRDPGFAFERGDILTRRIRPAKHLDDDVGSVRLPTAIDIRRPPSMDPLHAHACVARCAKNPAWTKGSYTLMCGR